MLSQDGTASGTVSITLTGTNDAATVSSDSKSLTETNLAADISTSGTLSIVDPDSGEAHSVAQAGTAGVYGSFAVDTNGAWTYTASSAHNELTAGQVVNDTFTVLSQDGTASGTVSITLTGSNDAAVITGISTGTVIEAGGVANATPGTPTATGDLLATDVDNATDVFLAVGAGAATANGYGTYGVNAAGVWTYTLNNNNAAVQALNTGSTPLTDTFTVLSADGTAKVVSVTINGTNDAATLSADVKNLTETNAALTTGGTLTVSDVDSPQTFVAQAGTAGAYGTFALGAAGAWTYTATSAHDEFVAGTTYTDTFSVASADGTLSSVTVNILGTNDAASDLIFSFTASPGNSLPNGAFGQMSLIDPDGGAGGYSFSLASLTATTLAGGAAANFAGDLTVSPTGVISASGLDEDRVYEATIQVAQGGATFTEVFSVVTGTNSGPGTDTINGGYVTGDDVIFARGANDVIFAGSGNDTVFGQAADDQIHGELGNDVLSGGAGNDTFYFDTALDPSTNVDTISDFNANTGDKIALDQTIFTLLSVASPLNAANFAANAGGNAAAGAAGADDYVLYDTATGNLFYDADGNGAGAKVLFATLTLAGVSGTVDSTDFTVIP